MTLAGQRNAGRARWPAGAVVGLLLLVVAGASCGSTVEVDAELVDDFVEDTTLTLNLLDEIGQDGPAAVLWLPSDENADDVEALHEALSRAVASAEIGTVEPWSEARSGYVIVSYGPDSYELVELIVATLEPLDLAPGGLLVEGLEGRFGPARSYRVS